MVSPLCSLYCSHHAPPLPHRARSSTRTRSAPGWPNVTCARLPVRRDPRSPCSQCGARPPVQRNPAHGPWCSGAVRGQWPACPRLGAPSAARPFVSLPSPARLSTPNTARVGPRCGSPAWPLGAPGDRHSSSLVFAWLAPSAAPARASMLGAASVAPRDAWLTAGATGSCPRPRLARRAYPSTP